MISGYLRATAYLPEQITGETTIKVLRDQDTKPAGSRNTRPVAMINLTVSEH